MEKYSQSHSPSLGEKEDTGKKPGGKIFLILFLTLFSLGFGILGTVMIHSAYAKERACSASAEGMVVGYRDASRGSKHSYSPIVEYQAENQIFTGETNIWFNYRPFQEGEYVSIHYNPEKPEDFYIKQYDLPAAYKMGAIFLLTALGIPAVLALFAVINRVITDPKKKERIQAVFLVSLIVLFIFIVFCALAGPVIAICIFAVMGLFTLYGIRQNRRRKNL